MKLKLEVLRVWAYRVLVAAACILTLLSFKMPWWYAFLGSGRTIHIYGWGLRHNLLQLAPYIAGDVTPIYQSVLAWCYIALVIIFVIWGMFLKGKKGMILMSLAGLSYVVYVSIAIYVVTTNRLADFNIALQGYSTIQQQIGSIVVNARLETGFYLAYIASIACFVLGLLRDIIQGKLKTAQDDMQ